MTDIEKLRKEYGEKKAAIKADERLSAKGKEEALRELTAHYLTAFKQEWGDVGELDKQLREQIDKLKKTYPEAKELTEQELLAEQREVNLLLSRLTAAGKEGFLKTAEEAASKRPGVFTVAYHKVLDVAEKYYPGPATRGEDYDPFDPAAIEMAGSVDLGQSNRPFIFSQLQRLYDQAAKATITPAELKQQQELEALNSQLTKNFMQGMRLQRNVERLEQELAFTFEDVAKANMR